MIKDGQGFWGRGRIPPPPTPKPVPIYDFDLKAPITIMVDSTTDSG